LPSTRFADDNSAVDYLYWSPNNIIEGPGDAFSLSMGCEGLSESINVDPPLRIMPSTADFLSNINPTTPKYLTPSEEFVSPAFSNVDTVPDDGFFDQVDFKGAFGDYGACTGGEDGCNTGIWLQSFSWLGENGGLSSEQLPDAPNTTVVIINNTRVVTEETVVTQDDGLADGEIAAILVVVIVLIAAVGGALYYVGKRKGEKKAKLEQDIESGAGTAATAPAETDEDGIEMQEDGVVGAKYKTNVDEDDDDVSSKEEIKSDGKWKDGETVELHIEDLYPQEGEKGDDNSPPVSPTNLMEDNAVDLMDTNMAGEQNEDDV